MHEGFFEKFRKKPVCTLFGKPNPWAWQQIISNLWKMSFRGVYQG